MSEIKKSYLSMEQLEEGKVFVGKHPTDGESTVYVAMVGREVKYGYAPDKIGMIASKKFFLSKVFEEYVKEARLTALGKALIESQMVLITVKTTEECAELMAAVETSTELRWRTGRKPTERLNVGHIDFDMGDITYYFLSDKKEDFLRPYNVIEFAEWKDLLIECC